MGRIEWTFATWNPVTGCSKASPGCQHCYAERMALRLQAMGMAKYADGFAVRCHDDLVELPLTWRKPHKVFVNSMGDLFHEEVPVEFIKAVFETMRKADWHQFQLLTKRSKRLRELAPELPWPKNLWMGVTVECEATAYRIADLMSTAAAVKWICAEPLLGPLPIDFAGLDWVIVGGESGPQARPMKAEWAREIRDRCAAAGVPFFFKQWGGVNKKRAGRMLDGRLYDGYPNEREEQMRLMISDF